MPMLTRRDIIHLIGAAITVTRVRQFSRGTNRSVGAGYVERLMYRSLASDLRRGRMTTVVNGEIVPEAIAERMLSRAHAEGWL